MQSLGTDTGVNIKKTNFEIIQFKYLPKFSFLTFFMRTPEEHVN